MTSPGKIAQPPQPIGSFQPTKVSPLTDAGAAMPEHQTGSPVCQHAGLVAHHAVGDERLHAALDHAHAQDVAEDAGILHAHRIGDRDAAFRHVLDRGARRDRLAPAFGRREILAHRHEAQA